METPASALVVLPSEGINTEHSKSSDRPVLLASEADRARLEQLLYSALESKLKVPSIYNMFRKAAENFCNTYSLIC